MYNLNDYQKIALKIQRKTRAWSRICMIVDADEIGGLILITRHYKLGNVVPFRIDLMCK